MGADGRAQADQVGSYPPVFRSGSVVEWQREESSTESLHFGQRLRFVCTAVRAVVEFRYHHRTEADAAGYRCRQLGRHVR